MQSCCDLEVEVNGEEIFWVDKKTLASFSNRIAILIRKLTDDFESLKVIFHDFPGGAESFELIVKYCYNKGKIDLTPSNFLLLHCAASFMEMNDDSPGSFSLVNQTKQHQKRVSCFTWNELLDCLKQCQKLLIELNGSDMLQHILECVVDRAILPCVPSRPSVSSSDSSCVDFSGDISIDSMRSNASQTSWWFKDLQFLSVELLKKVVGTMISQKVDHAVISSFLFYYQRKRFLDALPEEKGKMIETVINLLYMLDGEFISIKGLFHVHQVASNLKPKVCCIHKVESMIGSLLEEASPDDLLVPSRGKDYAYDVNIVLQFLNHFLSDENGKQVLTHRLKKVASLVDLYMVEVAPDPGLRPSKFASLVSSLPDFARDSHDKVYEAIDLYLKVHKNLCLEEKMKLCCALNYEKLTAGCLLHLAQNANFPAFAGDIALVSQQAKSSSSVTPRRCNRKGREDADEDPRGDKLESHQKKDRKGRVQGSLEKVLRKLHHKTNKTHISEPILCSFSKGRFLPTLCR